MILKFAIPQTTASKLRFDFKIEAKDFHVLSQIHFFCKNTIQSSIKNTVEDFLEKKFTKETCVVIPNNSAVESGHHHEHLLDDTESHHNSWYTGNKPQNGKLNSVIFDFKGVEHDFIGIGIKSNDTPFEWPISVDVFAQDNKKIGIWMQVLSTSLQFNS